MSGDVESDKKRAEDSNLIEKNLISLVKKYRYIYDKDEPVDQSTDRSQLISQTFDYIAKKLNKLVPDYHLTGDFVSNTWQSLLKILSLALEFQDDSYIHLDDMKYFTKYMDFDGEISLEKCKDGSARRDGNHSSSNPNCIEQSKDDEQIPQSKKLLAHNKSEQAPKEYKFNLSEFDVIFVHEVKKYPILHQLGSKNKKKRSKTFITIAKELYGEDFFAKFPNEGAVLEKTWAKIRGKCTYAFGQNRKTDQDDLLGFMKTICEKKQWTEQDEVGKLPDASTSKLNNPKLILRESTHDSVHDSVHGSDSSEWDIEDSEVEEEFNSELAAPKSNLPKPSKRKVNTKLDGNCMAIKELFSQIKKSEQKSAMVHLIQKLDVYKKTREAERQAARTS